eukprot:4320668-Prymnesium_polylepis.1
MSNCGSKLTGSRIRNTSHPLTVWRRAARSPRACTCYASRALSRSCTSTHSNLKIKGIPIPAGDGGGPPAPVLTSAFADDVCIFLEPVRQLTRFKELLHIYSIGAGALNSWEKTVACESVMNASQTTCPLPAHRVDGGD